MILITVGSQKFQFNRLLETVDSLISSGVIVDKVLAQSGYCTYIPKNIECKQFYNTEEFDALLDQADLVITHGGTGVIIKAVKKGKKVIAVPRRKEFGEHVDDHQEQIIEVFTEAGMIRGCKDCSEIRQAIEDVKKIHIQPYKSQTEKYIKSIDEFIQNI